MGHAGVFDDGVHKTCPYKTPAMIKVQSLSLRIVLQFAIVLLPLVAVLVFETRAEAARVSALGVARAAHMVASEAQSQFATFINGAADAVDTGRLSLSAHEALQNALTQIDGLRASATTDEAETTRLRMSLAKLVEATRADASLSGLSRAREAIAWTRSGITEFTAHRQRVLDRSIEFAIRDAEQTRAMVAVLSGATLLLAAVFMFQMIRGLSQPLRHAVDIADRIAGGRQQDDFEVETRRDVGGLLQSLQRMNQGLRERQAEVNQHRYRLEKSLAELKRNEQSLSLAQRTAKLGNWQFDAATGSIQWSSEMHRILSMPETTRPPSLRNFMRAIPPVERRTLWQHLRASIDRHDELAVDHGVMGGEGELLAVHHQLSAERDASGRLTKLYGTLQDVSDRQRSAEQMRRLAMIDGLTGLANRQCFNEQLRTAAAHARRTGTGLAALFIDLDRFKRINDTLGHAAGDQVLREAASRLLACTRESDTVAMADTDSPHLVARLGGDEFITLLRDISSPRDAAVVAQRVIQSLSKPFIICDRELIVTASVGIAMYPSDAQTDDELVVAADVAMYAAKRHGSNTFQFFSQEMNQIANEKLSLEMELRRAIPEQQFELHYQPKVDIETGAVFGTEALIRWNHPQLGQLAPGRFIELAEELGLIVAIGDWVLEEACRQAAAWRQAGLGEVNIAINLASPSFRQSDLVPRLAELFDRHAIVPKQIQIEATESMLMESAGQTLTTLADLRRLGVKLSIDDFGTGYSSLSYLKRFPIDQLKIDRSFVSEMVNSAEDAAIVGAIISLGKNMQRELVAEGVETLEQAHMLRTMGVTIMQGFLFSRPVSAGRMGDLLRRDFPFAAAADDRTAVAA